MTDILVQILGKVNQKPIQGVLGELDKAVKYLQDYIVALKEERHAVDNESRIHQSQIILELIEKLKDMTLEMERAKGPAQMNIGNLEAELGNQKQMILELGRKIDGISIPNKSGMGIPSSPIPSPRLWYFGKE